MITSLTIVRGGVKPARVCGSGKSIARGGELMDGRPRRPVPHYLLAFLAASLLGRRSCSVSRATAGETATPSAVSHDGRANFAGLTLWQSLAREASLETPGATTSLAGPRSESSRGGGVNPPARNNFLPAPVPDFRRLSSEARWGTSRLGTPPPSGDALADHCGAEEPISRGGSATGATPRARANAGCRVNYGQNKSRCTLPATRRRETVSAGNLNTIAA